MEDLTISSHDNAFYAPDDWVTVIFLLIRIIRMGKSFDASFCVDFNRRFHLCSALLSNIFVIIILGAFHSYSALACALLLGCKERNELLPCEYFDFGLLLFSFIES